MPKLQLYPTCKPSLAAPPNNAGGTELALLFKSLGTPLSYEALVSVLSPSVSVPIIWGALLCNVLQPGPHSLYTTTVCNRFTITVLTLFRAVNHRPAFWLCLCLCLTSSQGALFRQSCTGLRLYKCCNWPIQPPNQQGLIDTSSLACRLTSCRSMTLMSQAR